MTSRSIMPLLFAVFWAAACDPSDPCDPGQYEDHGACYSLSARGDGGSDDDAGADGADAAARSYSGFGKPCKQAADCTAAAPSCGAPMSPVCTAVNCMGDPGVCPPSWTCFDVSAFSPDPSVTSACVQL